MENYGLLDTPRNQIGFFDPENKQITTKTIPKLDPQSQRMLQYSFKQILMETFG